ncbi:MAG: CvpA family protein [Rhodoferax sp.]|nr:CvpA family protein [Rhodoferax sp.]
MQTLDWFFLLILGFSLLVGAWRGLVFEVISLVSWIAAFVLAQWFAPAVGRWLPLGEASEVLRFAAGFVSVFVAVIFAGGLVAFIVKKLVAAVGLSPADRMLGALFGIARGVLLSLVVAVLVGMTPLRTALWWQDSIGAQWATVVLHGMKPALPGDFGKYLP